MRALPLAPTTVPKSPDRGLRRSAATARGRNREQLETELDEARE
jgi:hypothetical protein